MWDQRVRHLQWVSADPRRASTADRAAACRSPIRRDASSGESLDEIFSRLPLDRGRSSMSCSLVSKSRPEPSRRFLFPHISIWRDIYQSRFDSIPPRNTGLLRYGRSLTCFLRAEDGAFRLYSPTPFATTSPHFANFEPSLSPTQESNRQSTSTSGCSRPSNTRSLHYPLLKRVCRPRRVFPTSHKSQHSLSFRVDNLPVPQRSTLPPIAREIGYQALSG